jgi:hypothetical protein
MPPALAALRESQGYRVPDAPARTYRHCPVCCDVVAHQGERCLACSPVTDRAPPTHPLGWPVSGAKNRDGEFLAWSRDGLRVQRYDPVSLAWVPA